MKTITVYSSKTCGPCKHIYHHLNTKGLEYEIKDISEDDNLKALLELTNTRLVPVTVITGSSQSRYVSGPNISELDKLIGELL